MHVMRRAREIPLTRLVEEYGLAEDPDSVVALRNALLTSMDAQRLRSFLSTSSDPAALSEDRLRDVLRGTAFQASVAIEAVPTASPSAISAYLAENEGELIFKREEGEALVERLLARMREGGAAAGSFFLALDRVVFSRSLLSRQISLRSRITESVLQASEPVRNAVSAALAAHPEVRDRYPDLRR
jgi:hypothetical protein